ncbi:MAG: long-chain fatty acid--CoA ligase [Chloroflexota bacterium]
MNISTWIDKNAKFSPNKIAIHFQDQSISYRELAKQISRVADMLQHHLHIKKGDRVGILSYNRVEYLTLLFACARIGAIYNPLNWRLAVPELTYIVENAGLKALFVEEELNQIEAGVIEKMPDCTLVGFDYRPTEGWLWETLMANETHESESIGQLDDPLMLVYTSGTTGRPKGAVLTQSNLLWNAANAVHMQNLSASDHALTGLPLFHVGGLNNQTTPIFYVGGTVTLHARFHPVATMEAIQTGRPTVTCLVPATMAACIATPHWEETDFSNLRLNVTGSTLVPTHLSDQFREKGIAVLEMYGLTETAPVSVYHRPDSDFSKPGSTGLPGLHTDIRIVDLDGNDLLAMQEGEVLIKGPNVMQGYWNNPKATAAAFDGEWFRTGDIGYRDQDGYLYIKDRKKNMIISGSENIYAAEVERVIYEHPAVAECALIGRPDPKWGEIPVAIIAPQPDQTLDEETVRSFMDGRLARYKLPKAYVFVDQLPKNAMGKIQHFILRDQYGTGFS